VLNLTVTNPSAASYLTVWPDGESQTPVSNLNFARGQTVANRVQVKVGGNGKVDIYNAAGTVDVVADLNGWFTSRSYVYASQGRFTGTMPTRILDTRNSRPALASGAMRRVQIAGVGDVPPDATAVVLNVTVTDTTAGSYVTLWPDGKPQPVASDLNWAAGETRANLAVVQVPVDGMVDVYNAAGSTDVIFDVVGWYTG
jgi:hypothetical protein